MSNYLPINDANNNQSNINDQNNSELPTCSACKLVVPKMYHINQCGHFYCFRCTFSIDSCVECNGPISAKSNIVKGVRLRFKKIQPRTTFFRKTEIQGVLTLPNGYKYEGGVKDGMMHGYGLLYYANGSLRYEGLFKDGLKHGEGLLYRLDGFLAYIGEFEDDELSGRGIYDYDDVIVYEGEMKNGQCCKTYYTKSSVKYEGTYECYNTDGARMGGEFKSVQYSDQNDTLNIGECLKGEFYFDSGSCYVGEFKKGQRNGLGRYVYADGSKYEGEFRDGMKHGQGTMYYSNGNRFVGEFKNGQKNGEGKSYYPNGDLNYEGAYLDDLKSGQGRNYYLNGARYEGEFRNGDKNGIGTYFWEDGSRYEGAWKDEKRHGHGIFYSKENQVVYNGEWKDDKFKKFKTLS